MISKWTIVLQAALFIQFVVSVTSFSPKISHGHTHVGPERKLVTGPVADLLQEVYNNLLASQNKETLEGVSELLVQVLPNSFTQSTSWKQAMLPMRATIAEVPGKFCISVLVLPEGTVLPWHRHPQSTVASYTLFGEVETSVVEMIDSAIARELAPEELAVVFTDALAVGGSEESDCVCRGGRCPRMSGCPFWVEMKQKQSKGRRAWEVRPVAQQDILIQGSTGEAAGYMFGPLQIKEIKALQPSALLEVHVGSGGPRDANFHRIIHTQKDTHNTRAGNMDVIEIMKPEGVRVGFVSYLGPFVA